MDYAAHRNRNKMLLGGLVLAQLVALGYQVRRPQAGGVRLVQLWGVQAVLPAEKASERLTGRIENLLHGYLELRAVNRRNAALQTQLDQLEVANQQLREQARAVPRLDALLDFEHSYRLRTLAAEVISSGASVDAQTIYLDRGASAGLQRNMPVVTPRGVVGKVSQVLYATSQVLLVTDPDSGAGALIATPAASGDAPGAVHGILHGLGAGHAELRNVLNGEPVAVGAPVITSGEDQVFPKGIPIGTVTTVHAGPIFQEIGIKLAADPSRLEDVLVITGRLPAAAAPLPDGLTAAAIRQADLPSLPSTTAGVAGATPNAPAASSTAWPVAAAGTSATPPAEGDALGGPQTAAPTTAAPHVAAPQIAAPPAAAPPTSSPTPPPAVPHPPAPAIPHR